MSSDPERQSERQIPCFPLDHVKAICSSPEWGQTGRPSTTLSEKKEGQLIHFGSAALIVKQIDRLVLRSLPDATKSATKRAVLVVL